MFFVLSKIFWFVVQPVNLILILLGLAVIACRNSSSKWSFRLLASTFTVFLIAAQSPLAYWLALPLEQRFSRPETLQTVDGILIIGGGFNTQISAGRGTIELDASGDRIIQGAVLARKHPNARIVYTGGRAGLIHNESVSADLAKELLIDLGIDETRITIERKSRNTFENAVFTKALVKPAKTENWIVVTSAFHMPRTLGVLQKIGWNAKPWPVDYFTGSGAYAGHFFLDSTGALLVLTTMTKEWIGLFVYWASGKTNALFPGPKNAQLANTPSALTA